MDRPRERALAVLCDAERGAFVSALLEQTRSSFGARDSAFILELVAGVLRNRLRIDWVLDRFSARPVSAADVQTRNILRLGAYQLLFLDRVPASAAVNTAVELAKARGGKHGYVNGLLRTVVRQKDRIPLPDAPDAAQRLSILYSHPRWLVERWIARIGPGPAEEVLQSNNAPAPLVIRTNTLRNTREELMDLLAAQGAVVRRTAYSPAGIEVLSSPGLTSLPAFREGRFLVQDEAAQLVGFILAPQPNELVLDACAAPGGKATHLAELMQDRGDVAALEHDEARMGRVRENSERLRLTIVRPVLGDAASFRGGSYDRILIDAPCSGLGVLRRHPDGRWTKQERSIRERAGLQTRILENSSGLLKPGGVLVYATCTTEPEENEEIVRSFLARRAEFALDDPRPHLPAEAAALVGGDLFFRTFPREPMMDGFFAARLRRTG